jgi:hypothetical protein
MPLWEPQDGTDPSQWAATVGRHRDSTLLEESNWAVVTADMQKRFPDDTEIVRFGHWGVGWVEELFVRIWDASGEITPAFQAAAEWRGALEGYPVANDEHYSQMEYDATLKNIENAGYNMVRAGAPTDWASRVFDWFWDNDQRAVENVDDTGGYPTEEQLAEALRALKLLDPDWEEG